MSRKRPTPLIFNYLIMRRPIERLSGLVNDCAGNDKTLITLCWHRIESHHFSDNPPRFSSPSQCRRIPSASLKGVRKSSHFGRAFGCPRRIQFGFFASQEAPSRRVNPPSHGVSSIGNNTGHR